MLQTVKHVTRDILWVNLHLLFWLSLVPFVTGWMGENSFAPMPMALYGVNLLMAAIAYFILQKRIITAHGWDYLLAAALGTDFKSKISPVLFIVAIISTYFSQWIATEIYVLVAFIWLIPDKRIENKLIEEGKNTLGKN